MEVYVQKQITIKGSLVAEFKGENGPQSPAGLYMTDTHDPLALGQFERIAGAPPSYNNWCDVDRLLQTMTHIRAQLSGLDYSTEYRHVALAAKHGNCCGACASEASASAITGMVTGDTRAIFGGVVMLNSPVDENDAMLLLHHESPHRRRLLSLVAAPSFYADAFHVFEDRSPKTILLKNETLKHITKESLETFPRVRHVRGGYLVQPNYTYVPDLSRIDRASSQIISPQEWTDLKIAWAIGATSNSNTITLVKMGQLIGNAIGQQDRIGAAELALKRATDAGHDPRGAVAYSDSFFAFSDAPLALIKKGVRVILATSGSVKDAEVRQECSDAGGVLVTLPDTEARGFFGH